MRAANGRQDELRQYLHRLKERANSDKEPGTLVYRVAEYEGVFGLWEEYANSAALQTYVASHGFIHRKANIIRSWTPKRAAHRRHRANTDSHMAENEIWMEFEAKLKSEEPILSQVCLLYLFSNLKALMKMDACVHGPSKFPLMKYYSVGAKH